MKWALATAQPLDPAAVYNGIEVREVTLRFPAGGQSGGEVVCARLVNGTPVGGLVTVPLEPGEPDAILEALRTFCESGLKAKAVMDASATVDRSVTEAPTPVEPPLGGLA